MARNLPRGSRLESLVRFLTVLIIVLILVILGGTFYAIIRGPMETAEGGRVPAAGSNAEGIGAEGMDGRSPGAIAVFTGIGRLRIPAGGGNSRITVVLSVVFPYPAEDRSFAEELTGKIPLFRRILRDYFGSLSPEELSPLNEDRAKAELLERFNRELRLGSIGVLFFNDFMILE
ncbi:MAG: flagellar basal body protein FliL [Treponema sp.]|nr:flagellar basal body protein FliL [Treponema sp.]